MKGMARPFKLMKHFGHWGGERMEELEFGPLGIFSWWVVIIAMFIIYAGIANVFTPGSENQGHLLMGCGAVSLILLAFSAYIFDESKP